MKKSGTPRIDLNKLDPKTLMVAIAGEDIVSKTGTEHLKGTKFSLDRTPPQKARGKGRGS